MSNCNLATPIRLPITSAADEKEVLSLAPQQGMNPAARPYVRWSFSCLNSSGKLKILPGTIIVAFVPRDIHLVSQLGLTTAIVPLFWTTALTSYAFDDGAGGFGVAAPRDQDGFWNLYWSVDGTSLVAGDNAQLNVEVEWR